MPVIYALNDYRFGQCRNTAEGRKDQPLRQAHTCAATAALLRADARGSGISVAARRSAFALDEPPWIAVAQSEEHTSELQSPCNLVCRLLLEKKKKSITQFTPQLIGLIVLWSRDTLFVDQPDQQ